MYPIPAATQHSRAQLPSALQPQLFINHARTGSAPSRATPVSGCYPPSKPITSFFLHFKHPGKCKFNCTSHTLGGPRGVPCLPAGLSQPKMMRFQPKPFQARRIPDMCCLACWNKKTAKKLCNHRFNILLNFASLLQFLSLNSQCWKYSSRRICNRIFCSQAETGLREVYLTHTKNFNINNQPSSHWFLRKLVCELSFILRFII